MRQALARFTTNLSKHTQLAFGVEDPDPEVVAPRGVVGKTEKTLPDFTGRFRWNNDRGHIQLSGFLSQTRFRPNKGEPTDVMIVWPLPRVHSRPDLCPGFVWTRIGPVPRRRERRAGRVESITGGKGGCRYLWL